MVSDGQHDREARFWDVRSGALDDGQLEVEHGVLGAEPNFRFLEEWVARVGPARLLDAGCGNGVGAVRLASYAGTVTGIDVSSVSLARAQAYASRSGVENIHLVRSPIEAMPFGDGSFDAVTGYFVLHHLSDLERGASEMARVLRPGGGALFVETWGRNPLLRAARCMAGALRLRQGTRDEKPLGRRELQCISQFFSRLELHFPSLDLFKHANYPLLLLHRRWGHVPVIRSTIDWLWKWPLALDALLYRRFTGLRPYGWRVVLELTR